MMELITRQAAIDALMKRDKELRNFNWYDKPWAECECNGIDYALGIVNALPSVQPTQSNTSNTSNALKTLDCIDRQAAIAKITNLPDVYWAEEPCVDKGSAVEALLRLPSAQPDLGKYEYHYDHTDCIWYRPEARNRCPATCAQYRDGWNDAMNYIFRDGKGYRPYRRGEKYE